MKKVLAIVLALALTLATAAVPVLATELSVGVGGNVTEGGGDAPIIKCKWEQDQSGVLEEGDLEHEKFVGDGANTSCNAQFLPSLTFNVSTAVEYWTIIADPDDQAQPDAIISVYVYHPLGPPENGSYKYQLRLEEVEKGLAYDLDGKLFYEPGKGIDKFIKAYEANLVTLAAGFDYDDIIFELEKCDAKIYMVVGELSYHQPCGNYRVVIKAVDQHNNHAVPLENCMTYVCMQAMRIDFTGVNYGNIMLSSEKWISGNTIFETPVGIAPDDVLATVHNIGNMPMRLKIKQDDMGFNFSGMSRTTYQDSSPPVGDNSSWDVYFDARLGNNQANAMYYDPCCLVSENLTACTAVVVTLPNILMPCIPEELDLSIHVIKGDLGSYSGHMILECEEAEWIP